MAAACGFFRIPAFAAWPLTALGTVVAYLLVGGPNVVLARQVARHTAVGRSQ